MFGRIFGRGKDDHDQAVCAECGRTLLAGEWTQTVVDSSGHERLICSLCGRSRATDDGALSMGAMPANAGRVRETRAEARPPAAEPRQRQDERDAHATSDAFWQALREKDAEIEHLKAQLARAQAERQELAGQFARLEAVDVEPDLASPAGEPQHSPTGDSSELGERTWGETPAEFAAEMAALKAADAEPAVSTVGAAAPAELAGTESPIAEEPSPQSAAPESVAEEGDVEAEETSAEDVAIAAEAEEAPAELSPTGPPPQGEDVAASAAMAASRQIVFEDTQPLPALSDEVLAEILDEDDSTGEIPAEDAAAARAGADAAGAAIPSEDVDSPPAPPEPVVDVEEVAASLTLLQRGVDLLNISPVPRRIAETNEQLGLPLVNVGFDGQTVAVTFMWSMGWYGFHVDIDSGDVRMFDRGYDELTGVPPNAGVRADGTVHLAPAQISRAAAQRPASTPAQAAASQAPGEEPRAPETPSVAAQKAPEILSKSLLGQRSDDETTSWEQTKARDFDWDR